MASRSPTTAKGAARLPLGGEPAGAPVCRYPARQPQAGLPHASDEQLVQVLTQVGLANLLEDDNGDSGLDAWLGMAGGRSPVASAAASASPAPCCTMRRSGCWMSRPRGSTARPSGRSWICCSSWDRIAPCCSSPPFAGAGADGPDRPDGRGADPPLRPHQTLLADDYYRSLHQRLAPT